MSQTLSAVDFLGLSEEHVVARVDLADVGRSGYLFVRELTADEKTAVLPRPRGKARMHKDQSIEIDWSQLSPDAVAKFLKTCLVTVNDPARYFGNGAETAVVPEGELRAMYDQMLEQIGKPHLVLEQLGKTPNSVADLLVSKIREISRLDDDGDDNDDSLAGEKKG